MTDGRGWRQVDGVEPHVIALQGVVDPVMRHELEEVIIAFGCEWREPDFLAEKVRAKRMHPRIGTEKNGLREDLKTLLLTIGLSFGFSFFLSLLCMLPPYRNLH